MKIVLNVAMFLLWRAVEVLYVSNTWWRACTVAQDGGCACVRACTCEGKHKVRGLKISRGGGGQAG